MFSTIVISTNLLAIVLSLEVTENLSSPLSDWYRLSISPHGIRTGNGTINEYLVMLVQSEHYTRASPLFLLISGSLYSSS